MHHLHDPAVFLEEIEAWGFLGQFVLRVVLQDFVDLEAQGKHYFLLFAELQVLTLVFQFQLFVSLVDSIQLFNEKLMRNC